MTNSNIDTTNNEMEFRREVIRQHSTFLQTMLRAHFEMSRWLLASLLFLHTSALGALLFKGTPGDVPTKASAAFVFGVVFAVASGFVAWINFNYLVEAGWAASDPQGLLPGRDFGRNDNEWKIKLTFYVTIFLGVISMIAWICGALSIMRLI